MKKYILIFLIIPMLLISSGCVLEIPNIFNSGQTATPVNTTVDISGVAGTTKTVVINRMQYVVGFEKTSYGAKYMIYPPSYPLGYEGQLTSGNSVTINVSSDKIYSMTNAKPEIWDSGGKWRADDTFTLSLNGDICTVKWTQTGNTDPTATITVIPDNPSPDQTIRLTASVSTGGDSDEIFTQWYLDGRDMEGWIYNVPEVSPYIRTLKELPSGSHTIELLIWDTGKNEKRITKTINLTSEIREPTALFTVSPESPSPSTDFYLYSTSTPNTDPNLNQRLTHEWYLDGVFLGSSTDYSMEVGKEKGLSTVGTHFVKLKVTNSEGLSSEVTKSFTISSATVVEPDGTITPIGCTVPCSADEQCVNGQCVPLPEASPLPKGTFTITVYNNQVAEVNNYQLRYRNTVTGRNDPSYQYITLNIEELSLNYMGVYEMERWYDNFNIAINPLRSEYNELVAMGLPDPLTNWKNISNFTEKKGGNLIDSGPGWSKSATYFITDFTEQYVTVQITETVNTFTYCGDGTCNTNENCMGCPADCGICSDEDKIKYNTAPSARFDYTLNGKQIIVNSKSTDSDGTIKSLTWVFGNGNLKENGNAMETYTYTDYGTYVVTLFAKDNLDAISKTTATINIIPPTAYEDQDTDGDGVLNSKDSCVLQYGSTSNNGCPVVTSIQTTSAQTATCGDNTCNTNEDCATCPSDCGSCPVTTPSGDTTTTSTVSGVTGTTATYTVSGVSANSDVVANQYGSGISNTNIASGTLNDLSYYIEKIKDFLMRDFFGLPYWAIGLGVLAILYLNGLGGKKKPLKLGKGGKKR